MTNKILINKKDGLTITVISNISKAQLKLFKSNIELSISSNHDGSASLLKISDDEIIFDAETIMFKSDNIQIENNKSLDIKCNKNSMSISDCFYSDSNLTNFNFSNSAEIYACKLIFD